YFNIFDFYISLSEEEMNKGYADIVMKPFYFKYPDIKYSYLIEFKYIARTDSDKELKAEISKKLKDAETKLAQYADDDFAKKMMCTAPYGDVKLKKIIVIFHGWEMVYLMENL
ncbi:MAG: PD-(D/E)XK nuclease domain-containing protein, partial [Candidatus Delongbacteria bacterium]|nr:PD-(D/E)XK nuclease domain-containing protein [Candidatus Delongbacteria bacterium]